MIAGHSDPTILDYFNIVRLNNFDIMKEYNFNKIRADNFNTTIENYFGKIRLDYFDII